MLQILGFDFWPLEDTFYRPRTRLFAICRSEHRSRLILTGFASEWKQLHLDSFARSRDIFDCIRADPVNSLGVLLLGNWMAAQTPTENLPAWFRNGQHPCQPPPMFTGWLLRTRPSRFDRDRLPHAPSRNPDRVVEPDDAIVIGVDPDSEILERVQVLNIGRS